MVTVLNVYITFRHHPAPVVANYLSSPASSSSRISEFGITKMADHTIKLMQGRQERHQTTPKSQQQQQPFSTVETAGHQDSVMIRHETVFSACMLIKDDNDLLNEWIAYHYHTTRMRHLVVAIDPSSLTSPAEILNRWQNITTLALHDPLHIVVWNDADYMPKVFLEKGFYVPAHRINGNATESKWHDGHEDAETVKRDTQRILNHRYRQVTFLSACFRHLRRHNQTLAMHIDTDEYLTINPILRQDNGQAWQGTYKVTVPTSLNLPATLLNFLQDVKRNPFLSESFNYPCISMPRLLFGSKAMPIEQRKLLESSIQQSVNFVLDRFESLRWKYHTAFDDKERNAQPKVIVDVSVVDEKDQMFRKKPFSIHRPSMALCRRIDQLDFKKKERYPLTVNHYLGSWERYIGRNDSRRSRRFYDFKSNVTLTGGGGLETDNFISSWLNGFVQHVGPTVARSLLKDYVG
jgi:hypothetical protein